MLRINHKDYGSTSFVASAVASGVGVAVGRGRRAMNQPSRSAEVAIYRMLNAQLPVIHSGLRQRVDVEFDGDGLAAGHVKAVAVACLPMGRCEVKHRVGVVQAGDNGDVALPGEDMLPREIVHQIEASADVGSGQRWRGRWYRGGCAGWQLVGSIAGSPGRRQGLLDDCAFNRGKAAGGWRGSG